MQINRYLVNDIIQIEMNISSRPETQFVSGSFFVKRTEDSIKLCPVGRVGPQKFKGSFWFDVEVALSITTIAFFWFRGHQLKSQFFDGSISTINWSTNNFVSEKQQKDFSS